jgi:hypothetical protein
MAGHELIRAHTAALARRLPAPVVDELADGLNETWHRHLAAGLAPAEAARAAIVEFGSPAQITDAFVAQAPGRRTALVLLATGPVAALSWGTTLVTSRAWSWPVSRALPAVLGCVLLLAVAALLLAATSRHSYRRTRIAHPAVFAVAGVDMTMLTILLVVAPQPAWPVFAAVCVSLIRLGLATRMLRRALTHA